MLEAVFLFADVWLNFAFFAVLHCALTFGFALFLRGGPAASLGYDASMIGILWIALAASTPLLLEIRPLFRLLNRAWSLLPFVPIVLLMLTRVEDARTRSVVAVLALPFVGAHVAVRLARPASSAVNERTFEALALALLAHVTIRLGSFSASPSLYHQLLFGFVAVVCALLLMYEERATPADDHSVGATTATRCCSTRAVLALVPCAWIGNFLLFLVLHLIVSPSVIPRYAGLAPQPLAALLVLVCLTAGVLVPFAFADARPQRIFLGVLAALTLLLGLILLLTLNLFGGLLFAFSVGPTLFVWVREMKALAAQLAVGRVLLLSSITFCVWLPLYAANWFSNLAGSPKDLLSIPVPNRVPYWETFIIPGIVTSISTLLLSIWGSPDIVGNRQTRQSTFALVFGALVVLLFVPAIAVNAGFAHVVERDVVPSLFRVATLRATLGLDASGYQNLAQLGASVDTDQVDFVALQGSNALSFGTGSHDISLYLGAVEWQMFSYDSSAAEGLAPSHGVALLSHKALTSVAFFNEPCRLPDLYRQPCTGRAFASAFVTVGDKTLRFVSAGPRLDPLAVEWMSQFLNSTDSIATVACFDFDSAQINASAVEQRLSALGLKAATTSTSRPDSFVWHSSHLSAMNTEVGEHAVVAALELRDARQVARPQLDLRVQFRQRNGIIFLLLGVFVPILFFACWSKSVNNRPKLR